MKHEYKGVKHQGLEYYLRDLLKFTEQKGDHGGVLSGNSIHSSGSLYPDFEAAIRQYLNSKKGK